MSRPRLSVRLIVSDSHLISKLYYGRNAASEPFYSAAAFHKRYYIFPRQVYFNSDIIMGHKIFCHILFPAKTLRALVECTCGRLTDALVGLPCCRALPRPVVVEGFAPVALRSPRVVLALAHEVPFAVLYALGRVSVTLAPASDLEIRHRVKVRVPGELRVVLVLVPERVEPVEGDFDICCRDPVLQNRGVVEVVRRGSAVQRAEGDQAAGERLHVGVGVGADGFLLVLLGDGGFARLVVHLLALGRVELERHPGFPVIHGLVDGHGLGARGAELEAHVRHLELLPERQHQRHVLRELDVVVALPAAQVVRVVQVGEVRGRVALLRVPGVAYVAVPRSLLAFLGHHAVPGRRRAAGAGHAHVLPKRGVHKVGDAAPGVSVLVVARVGRRGLRREHAHPVSASSSGRRGEDGQRGDARYQNPYHRSLRSRGSPNCAKHNRQHHLQELNPRKKFGA
ncbi:hypothetical protein DNTS_018795 [Danionella cerebrum]|uniref:Uncharacterized protein n=1 Tax=Danionella cerebrum TaxID=2873325 RepID=A0A553QNU1_9TELE|nr:hypothetical protein DNTS_018795 [Danionella translucida]